MPFTYGCTTPMTAFAAIAASTALPPTSRMCAPAWEARNCGAATIPSFVTTIDLPWPGREGNCCAATVEQSEIMRAATRVFIRGSFQNSLRIGNGQLTPWVDPSFSQQELRELEKAIDHYCSNAHRDYREHFDAQSAHFLLVFGGTPHNRQIYCGTRQRSKNRRASRQSRTDISVHC